MYKYTASLATYKLRDIVKGRQYDLDKILDKIRNTALGSAYNINQIEEIQTINYKLYNKCQEIIRVSEGQRIKQ